MATIRMFSYSSAARALGLAVLCLAAAVLGAAAQQLPTSAVPTNQQGSLGIPSPDTVGTGAAPSPTRGGPLLDRQVSRTEYNLGPGDVLTVAILGYTNRVHSIAVTPEGTVVLPNVGVVRVGGLSIEEAERVIARTTRRFFREADVSVSLAEVRSFKIYVVGRVDSPGVRHATAVTRVSEVVPPTNQADIPRRNVFIRRADGDTIRVDLASFLQTGDLTHNPTVLEGDIVQVPRVDETVTLTGELTYPGVYEYRAGESLADLLRLANAGGPFPSAAADSLWLMRFRSGGPSEIQTIAREDAIGGWGETFLLRPFDAIYLPRVAHYGVQRTARIGGEVMNPGVYPIHPEVTTVRDLVAMAGGFTPRASLLDAVLRRNPVEQPRDSLRLLENIPPEFLTRDERRVLQVTSRADDRNVVINFADLFAEGGTDTDLPLQSGDYLFVPERREEIVVMGAVVQPGIVEYEAGMPIEHFVAQAGGYSRRADRGDVVVIKAKLGSRLHVEDVTAVEPGDRIVVPFKEEITFLERIQTVQGVASTVSGLVLTIIGIERLWDRVR